MKIEHSELRECAMNGKKLEGEYIIDAHTHIGGSGRVSHTPDSFTDEIVGQMDRLGVAKAIILPFPGTTSDFVYGNTRSGEAVRQYPDRFVGLASVNPHYINEMEAELKRCRDMELRGVRLVADYPEFPIESPNFFPAYEFAHEHGWIMENQTWGAPQFLDNVATAFSNACFIVGLYTLQYADLIPKHDNIYQSTAGAVNFADIENLVKAVPIEKIIFGSDFPELPLMFGMGPILYARISDEEKRKILGFNAKQLLEEWPGK